MSTISSHLMVDPNAEDEEINEKTPILPDDVSFESKKQKGHNWYFYFLVFFAALGGFLFGYDTGVISGAMIPLKRIFKLSSVLQEIIVAIAIAGAIIGAFCSGLLNEKLGRRPVMLIASALFTFGSLMLGGANGITMLLLGRIVVGLGFGCASMTVPVYLSEVSPASIRGQVVTIYQLFITFGQFVASVINGAFSSFRQDGWRYMLGVSGIPSFVMFLGCLIIPESPRWFIKNGRNDEARKVLKKLRGRDVDEELEGIITSNAESQVDIKSSLKEMIMRKSTQRALILGCGLQAFQQFSGINTVMYYSATIIQMAGVTSERLIIWLAAAVAFGNFIFTLVSFMLIERVGRRKLTLGSVFGVFLALLLLAVTFFVLQTSTPPVTYSVPAVYTKNCLPHHNCFSCIEDKKCGFCYLTDGKNAFNGSCLSIDPHLANSRSILCNVSTYSASSEKLKWSTQTCPTPYSWLAVIAMIFYLAAFAPGLGPMPWTVNAEIYPLWARSAGSAASTTTNWVMNMIVSLTFLSLMEVLTRPGTFILYAVITFLGLVFLYFLLPETKGKKLEEIEELFEKM